MRAGYEAYACVLGGADRRTLYICTAQTHDQTRLKALRSSRIECVRVDFAGVGVP
jgi:sugar lactone lactonase YvrE